MHLHGCQLREFVKPQLDLNWGGLQERHPIDRRVSQVCSHLATLTNCHWKLWLVPWVCGNILHLSDHQKALTQHAPKHHVLVVEPVCFCTCDEELAAI